MEHLLLAVISTAIGTAAIAILYEAELLRTDLRKQTEGLTVVMGLALLGASMLMLENVVGSHEEIAYVFIVLAFIVLDTILLYRVLEPKQSVQ